MTLWIVLCAAMLPALIVLALTSLWNARHLRKPSAGPGTQAGLVSVIVPARNEERNIERCVRSLLGQQGVESELIVVDDNSEDGTREILNRLCAQDPRLRVVDGAPLPAGWTGKNWACWQGYRAARGEVLLFTDADTFHRPGALAAARGTMAGSGAGLLSMLVAQETGTFGLKLLVPVLFWLACALFPFALMNADARLPLHFGNGQFMMFTRRAYDAIGGHQAIRGSIFDDMTLARRMRASGQRTFIADGSRMVSCRMYETLPAAFEGLGKNVYTLVRSSLPAAAAAPSFLAGLAAFAGILLGPLASLLVDGCLVAAGYPVSLPVIGISLAGIGLTLLSVSVITTRFRFPALLVPFYPLAIVLFLAAAVGSLVRHARGTATWKGRVLAGASL
jgi:chlorobactene glucosyltransferase